MKTYLVLIALTLASQMAFAQITCIDGHEKEMTQKMTELLTTSLMNFFKKKGIEVDQASIQLTAAATTQYDDGTSYEGDTPHPQWFGSFDVDNASAKSATGTKFDLYFTGPSNYQCWPFYKIIARNKGYDKEGNPIDSHCSLKLVPAPTVINYATSIEVRNSSSGKVIGKFALPATMDLY